MLHNKSERDTRIHLGVVAVLCLLLRGHYNILEGLKCWTRLLNHLFAGVLNSLLRG
jgi:hypothetical protein